MVPGLHLPRFTLEQYKSAYCDVITNTGKVTLTVHGGINLDTFVLGISPSEVSLHM